MRLAGIAQSEGRAQQDQHKGQKEASREPGQRAGGAQGQGVPEDTFRLREQHGKRSADTKMDRRRQRRVWMGRQSSPQIVYSLDTQWWQ